MHVVYIDAVFFINFCMDAAILYVTGWMARKIPVWWRLLLGSAMGASYSLLLFVPGSGSLLVSVVAKLVFSCVMVAATFMPTSFVEFLRVWGLFYLSSFVIGGAAFATNSIFADTRLLGGMVWVGDNSLWTSKILLPAIVLSVPLTLWIGKRLWRRMERIGNRVGHIWQLRVVIDDKQAELVALMDTGNALTDPLSRLPVAVVEWEALQQLLPVEINEMYRLNKNPMMELADKSLDAAWQSRFRFVPYRGVGGTMGMLLAFRPSRFVIIQDQKQLDISKILIAINPRPMSGDKSYQAILPLDTLTQHESNLVS